MMQMSKPYYSVQFTIFVVYYCSVQSIRAENKQKNITVIRKLKNLAKGGDQGPGLAAFHSFQSPGMASFRNQVLYILEQGDANKNIFLQYLVSVIIDLHTKAEKRMLTKM